jgi:hypothetical protein
MMIRKPIELPPVAAKNRPQLGGSRGQSLREEMPHIGTVLTWIRNQPLPTKFGVKGPLFSLRT